MSVIFSSIKSVQRLVGKVETTFCPLKDGLKSYSNFSMMPELIPFTS
jgi:hypothetical protein